jgi:hypothetical protein
MIQYKKSTAYSRFLNNLKINNYNIIYGNLEYLHINKIKNFKNLNDELDYYDNNLDILLDYYDKLNNSKNKLYIRYCLINNINRNNKNDFNKCNFCLYKDGLI